MEAECVQPLSAQRWSWDGAALVPAGPWFTAVFAAGFALLGCCCAFSAAVVLLCPW